MATAQLTTLGPTVPKGKRLRDTSTDGTPFSGKTTSIRQVFALFQGSQRLTVRLQLRAPPAFECSEVETALKFSYPGLFFFFSLSAITAEDRSVVILLTEKPLQLEDAVKLHQRGRCPVHGPFSCPCHALYSLAKLLQSALCEMNVACSSSWEDLIHYDLVPCGIGSHVLLSGQCTGAVSISVVLFLGSDSPSCHTYSFGCPSFASTNSIRGGWRRYCQWMERADAHHHCQHCGVSTDAHCFSCGVSHCDACSHRCERCGQMACMACCVHDTQSGCVICSGCWL